MSETFTEKELETAFNECGGCMSCGWHSAWYEIGGYEKTDRKGFPNEYWAPCNSEDDDNSDHRGYYFYPEHKKESK